MAGLLPLLSRVPTRFKSSHAFAAALQSHPLFGELNTLARQAELRRLKTAEKLRTTALDTSALAGAGTAAADKGQRKNGRGKIGKPSGNRDDVSVNDGDDDDVDDDNEDDEDDDDEDDEAAPMQDAETRAKIKRTMLDHDLASLRDVRLTAGDLDRLLRRAVPMLLAASKNASSAVARGAATAAAIAAAASSSSSSSSSASHSLRGGDDVLFPELLSSVDRLALHPSALTKGPHPSFSSTLWPPVRSLTSYAHAINASAAASMAVATMVSPTSTSASTTSHATGAGAAATAVTTATSASAASGTLSRSSVRLPAPLRVSSRATIDSNARLFTLTVPTKASPSPSIRMVDLKDVARVGPAAPSREYLCALGGDVSVGLPATADSLTINATGTFMLVSSLLSCIVVRLPAQGIEEEVTRSADRVVCPAVVIGRDTRSALAQHQKQHASRGGGVGSDGDARKGFDASIFDANIDPRFPSSSSSSSFSSSSSSPSSTSASNVVAVRQAMWHPLSPTHLVVLYADNVLAIFDVERDCRVPEQSFNLDAPQYNLSGFVTRPGSTTSRPGHSTAGSRQHTNATGAVPPSIAPSLSKMASSRLHATATGPRTWVSFTFGPSSRPAEWDIFAIYLLSAQGTIACLCPVVPYGAVLPINRIAELRRDTMQQIQDLNDAAAAAAASAMVTSGIVSTSTTSRFDSALPMGIPGQPYYNPSGMFSMDGDASPFSPTVSTDVRLECRRYHLASSLQWLDETFRLHVEEETIMVQSPEDNYTLSLDNIPTPAGIGASPDVAPIRNVRVSHVPRAGDAATLPGFVTAHPLDSALQHLAAPALQRVKKSLHEKPSDSKQVVYTHLTCLRTSSAPVALVRVCLFGSFANPDTTALSTSTSTASAGGAVVHSGASVAPSHPSLSAMSMRHQLQREAEEYEEEREDALLARLGDDEGDGDDDDEDGNDDVGNIGKGEISKVSLVPSRKVSSAPPLFNVHVDVLIWGYPVLPQFDIPLPPEIMHIASQASELGSRANGFSGLAALVASGGSGGNGNTGAGTSLAGLVSGLNNTHPTGFSRMRSVTRMDSLPNPLLRQVR